MMRMMKMVSLDACIFFMVAALLISAKNPNGIDYATHDSTRSLSSGDQYATQIGLQNSFYLNSCPQAEIIIKNTINDLSSAIAPALIRLAFHDCFVQGCDASVLLDGIEGEEASEKESIPNKKSLKGYHIIDIIKKELEEVCPETVSCADIIVLSATHAVVKMGGPFLNVKTGSRDSTSSFMSLADTNLPSPFNDVQTMISTFKGKGFTEKEMVSLLGAHSIGKAHCRFFEARLSNFNGTTHPDPTMDVPFRSHLSSVCNRNATSADPVVDMDNGSASSLDGHYYRNVREGKGLLYVDQALMAAEVTRQAVELYASNQEQFYHDFSEAMIKLFNLNVLTGKQGQIRKECSKIVNSSGRSQDRATFKDPQAPIP